MPLHTGKGRTVGTAIEDIIDYVKNSEKTDHGKLITSWQCDSRTADAEFTLSKQQYTKKTGRVRGEDNVIAYHLRQSFRPGEITPDEANRLGCELARRFTKGNHAFIICTHIDKAHVHNHIIWNSTTLDESRKFRNFWGSTRAIRRLSDTICIQNGYSIVENPKGKGQTYDKWLGDQKKPSHRERICYAIDDALAQKPDSFEALLKLLEDAGYQIKDGNVPSILGGDQKRFLRMDTLGENYTPDALRAIISGERKHTPHKCRVHEAAPRRNGTLLIDIQAKLNEGKGAGYAHFAKLYNLKQLSKTMLFLEENDLLDEDVFNTRVEEATAEYHILSDKIKAAEKRMAEISILQKHIQNYRDTRKVYVEYRKAGYSKKFLAEHEPDIIKHKAAKNYFDTLGLETLPESKELKREYAKLLAEKKSISPDYYEARDRMKELQIAKANVDQALNLKIMQPSKEKQSAER